MELTEIWKVLAGVALFLLGIRFMEESLQQLAGRQFKLFLKKQTSSKAKAITGGAIVTAVLQSSSVVSLMVLAFVGAGIISMQNALAVIMGANLGTTATGWLVAMAGFRMNIETLALPIAGIAGLGFAIFSRHGKWYNWSRFLLGFSFLFIGLGYMKTGMEGFVTKVGLEQYAGAPLIVFFIAGFMITSLIQSSSATMAITLSALYAGALTLNDSIAIVLGSEVGTTIKLFMASIKGAAAKRRVALGNFLFNIITVTLVFIFLVPLSRLVMDLTGIRDELVALVFFQSLVNILGILLFYPFLGIFGRYLESLFTKSGDETLFLHKADLQVPQAALIALENEAKYFIHAVVEYARDCYQVKEDSMPGLQLHPGFRNLALPEKYEHIKFLYGEIHGFYIRLQKNVMHAEESEKLDRLMSSVRNGMYAAKSIKDAIPDMEQLENSANDIKFGFYGQTRESIREFCSRLLQVMNTTDPLRGKELAAVYHAVTEKYNSSLRYFYEENIAGYLSETEITTLLNFNREIVTAFKSLVFAAKDHLLDREGSRYFEDLPGFIR